MPVVVPSGAFGQTAQKTVDYPQLPFFAGRRFTCRGAEADSHGLACYSAVAVCFLVVDAPVVQVPVVVTTGSHGSDSAEFRGGSAIAVPSRLWTSLCLRSDELSRDATDSVHRRSPWTFQLPQRQLRTVAVVHGRHGGGDEE